MTSARAVRLLLALALMTAGTLAAAATQDRGLLWTVDDGGRTTAYLLGSIHVGTESLYPLPKAVQTAFTASDALAVEADIVKADLSSLSEVVAQKGLYRDGRRLNEVAPPGLWQKLERVCERYGLPTGVLAPQKPWLAYNTVTMLALRGEGYHERHGIDRHLLEQAHQRGMPVIELEGAEAQLGLLAGLPSDVSLELLRQTTEEILAGDIPMAEMLDAWRSGDAEAVQRVVEADLTADLQPVYDTLIVERNRTMTRRIIDELRPQRTLFVVVGAAHMPGPSGLVRALRERGYTVEQQ
jgi:hypothetical protein